MSEPRFRLVAEVSSDNPIAIRPVLEELPGAAIRDTSDGFHVEAVVVGTSARALNRSLLSALRRAERRTRLRAAWHSGDMIERFFDYLPKGKLRER
jgi:hypothetical protein